MKTNGRRRPAVVWAAAAVITVLGALYWAFACSTDLVRGDVPGTLVAAILMAARTIAG